MADINYETNTGAATGTGFAKLPEGCGHLVDTSGRPGPLKRAAVLMALGLKAKSCMFGHGAVHDLHAGLRLYDSYHCSRYNTQTRRLTPEMFQAVFARIVKDFKE